MQNSKKTIFHGENYIPPSPSIESSPANSPVCYHVKKWLSGIIFFLAIGILSSCGPARNTIYFKNLQKDTLLRNVVTPDYELKIQKNDMLGITVASLSPDVAFYNAPQNSVGAVSGYLVDQEGNITFVKLGTLHVQGMTRKELKDSLQKGLFPYLRDAVISVSFLNRHVTMLGALTTQVIPMPLDNMTLLDALAASGDIGAKGKIDNVLVIRDQDSSKQFKRLNLKDNSVFYSPYYYLQPNDIVYVEPAKIRTPLTTAQFISYITTGISLLILILNTVKL